MSSNTALLCYSSSSTTRFGSLLEPNVVRVVVDIGSMVVVPAHCLSL